MYESEIGAVATLLLICVCVCVFVQLLLRHRMAVAVSERLVNTIVDTIRTPLSSPEPPTTQPSVSRSIISRPLIMYHSSMYVYV